MKKLILITLLTTGCVQNMDKYAITNFREFHYGQRVIVTRGFNVGRKGYVKLEGRSYSDCYRTYYIVFDEGPDFFMCNKLLIEDKEVK